MPSLTFVGVKDDLMGETHSDVSYYSFMLSFENPSLQVQMFHVSWFAVRWVVVGNQEENHLCWDGRVGLEMLGRVIRMLL